MTEQIKSLQLFIVLLALISTTSITRVESQSFRIPQTIFFGKNRNYEFILIWVTNHLYKKLLPIDTKFMLHETVLGAIFQEGDIAIPLERAFRHAIHHVNKDRTVLGNTRLVEKTDHVTPSNSFKASRKGE